MLKNPCYHIYKVAQTNLLVCVHCGKHKKINNCANGIHEFVNGFCKNCLEKQ